MTSHAHFDFGQLTPRQRYKLIIGTVVPRPIALVTSVDENGRFNAAPYSFFNCLSADPAILALGVENKPGMAFKDTAHNVRMTGEFTVNIVSDAMVEQMNICAVPFPSSMDELEAAGFTAVPGTHVRCPRIGEAPASLECRRYVTLELGPSREIIMGLVVGAHIRADAVDGQNHYVNQALIDAVGRMGGHGYATTRDYFDLPTMSLDEWENAQPPARSYRAVDIPESEGRETAA